MIFKKKLDHLARFSIEDLQKVFFARCQFIVDDEVKIRLDATRRFIDYLLNQQIKVYGLTTGFADLRNRAVKMEEAALLSMNMIRSHDAGIGVPIPEEITFGAMFLRAHSLSKGYSGFSCESLETLVSMLNARIIPQIPSTGSLGASGDLAFLARLGRAMMGDDVPVTYQGQLFSAGKALDLAGISKMRPQAKEGLALTNGTSFMASMLAFAYLEQMRCLENLFSLVGLFLNSVSAIDAAFYDMVQTVRYQKGQVQVARILKKFLTPGENDEVQNDYCIRCLPQILGPKLEIILEQKDKIENELNAITDNPLIFKGSEISADVLASQLFTFEDDHWAVVSGGNFHGEIVATVADTLAIANAKIALTLERQMTYMLNPFRNKGKLPIYLVADSKQAGFLSGYMITQYTANALAHKIALLGQPASVFNMTSANESEDVVSYGATAAQKLLEQLLLMEELLAIYLVTAAQAYSIARCQKQKRNPQVEMIYDKIASSISFPSLKDEGFDRYYQQALTLLRSNILRDPLHRNNLKNPNFSKEKPEKLIFGTKDHCLGPRPE